ncbi:UPF0547 protein C16orf87 homolog isoform X1 [Anser cygnoides]|uniref:UPF0547 protein C16orf87 homolog isoform X1 n=1 Tax=Anser cygnoides TaxID=8845 RepID=UPI0034D1912D
MSSSRAKKVKMATKSCPECDQQVPVACKSCPCGYIFISRKLLHAKRAERSPPIAENKSEAKRRRTERVKREKINSAVNKDLENRKRSRSNSHSDHSRRGRGRPKSASAKKHEEERGKKKKSKKTTKKKNQTKAAFTGVVQFQVQNMILKNRLVSSCSIFSRKESGTLSSSFPPAPASCLWWFLALYIELELHLKKVSLLPSVFYCALISTVT